MRTLILISFFACLYLHFQSSDAEVQELDTLSTKQASIKKETQPKVNLPILTYIQGEQAATDTRQEVAMSDVTEPVEYEDDDLSQLPWDDIEEGWKSHLKDYLVSVSPDKAEQIYSAYLEEKKKYVERVDFSDSENGIEADLTVSASDPLVESDGKEGELERLHLENLKEIFGDHFSQVESLHRDYVESVQYLNRSSVKFSISL